MAVDLPGEMNVIAISEPGGPDVLQAERRTVPQPGSLDAEAGIFASSFDLSGTRFITCESDKSIKIWKEDAEATEETHSVDMDAWEKQCAQARRY